MGSLHPREQIPYQCPSCGHNLIEVTIPWECRPGKMETEKHWDLVHADQVTCNCDCLEAPWPSHKEHKCMACGHTIMSFEEEIGVRIKPFGIQFRHVNDDGCRRAMSKDYGSRMVVGGLVRGGK